MWLVSVQFAEQYLSLVGQGESQSEKDMSSMFFPFFSCALFLNSLQSIILVWLAKENRKMEKNMSSLFFPFSHFLDMVCF
jgi:hypothetical protein